MSRESPPPHRNNAPFPQTGELGRPLSMTSELSLKKQREQPIPWQCPDLDFVPNRRRRAPPHGQFRTKTQDPAPYTRFCATLASRSDDSEAS
jgi:hypothetical protein